MFFVVSFDIVDNRTRYRAVKIIKGYGTRVQKSVFECPDLTEEQFLKMKRSLEALIEHHEDTVRYYALCRDCLQKVEWTGIGSAPETAAFKSV